MWIRRLEKWWERKSLSVTCTLFLFHLHWASQPYLWALSEHRKQAPPKLRRRSANASKLSRYSFSRRAALYLCTRKAITAKMKILVLCRTMTPWLWRIVSSWISPLTAIPGTMTIPKRWPSPRKFRDCIDRTVLKKVIVHRRYLRDPAVLSCKCYGTIIRSSIRAVRCMEIRILRILTIITLLHKKVSYRMNNKGFCFALIYHDSFSRSLLGPKHS